MSKGRRIRAARATTQQHQHGAVSGWHSLDALDQLDDAAFNPPNDALLDTSNCPVGESCAGCGATTGLHAVTSAFSRPGGFDVGCATLCPGCDGQSFLHLLGLAALDEAFAKHATH